MLIDVVRDLVRHGAQDVVVVDDGSPAEYDPIFATLATMPGTTLVRHPRNLGKGEALRAGMRQVLQSTPDSAGVVTADADGQHTVTDILAVSRALAEATQGERRVMVLGERNFDLPDIPWRSRLGNKVTSTVLRALSGRNLPDTQTGLRGLSADLLPELLSVTGDRFEYEMRALLHLLGTDVYLVHVPILTIYENGENATTHFRPVRDSVIVYATMLRQLGGFVLTSGSGFLVDIVIFASLMHLVFDGEPSIRAVGIATVVARACSALVNYGLNRALVFRDEARVHRSLGRYVVLAVGIVAVSWLLTAALTPLMGRHVVAVKVAVDVGLFVLSFLAQRRWVFSQPAPVEVGPHSPALPGAHTWSEARRSPEDRPPSFVAPHARAGAARTD